MYEALYFHIPFCKKRCAYCDFITQAISEENEALDVYLDSLIVALRNAARKQELGSVKTIYIGGGTPTHFGYKRLVELCYLISLTIRLELVEEFTLEANPESLTLQMVKDLYALGVNRLSIGAQSFVDTELAVLGRIHNASKTIQAFEDARSYFKNISLDLMCGIPGQTSESWQYSLEKALTLSPEHISVYPLQVEEGTPLSEAIDAGELTPPDEDAVALFLEQAAEVLEAAGYHRYEVASYAREGKESKHNSVYWTGASYLGIGYGAASMKNLPDGSRERWLSGKAGEPFESADPAEILTQKEVLAEDLMLGMRMSVGISTHKLAEAAKVLPEANEVFDELRELELVTLENDRYRPTQKGWLLGNEMYARIWQLGADSV